MTLPTQKPAPAAPSGPQPLAARMEPPASGIAGTSLVTCCKNRNENLIRALPSWLALPEVTEIVIVDWSSDEPVADSLAAAGIADPRIRVARVEDEPRWILSYAFNLGFRLARGQRVLKADADIVLEAGFFAANPLGPGRFIAGNWRTAAKGQEFVNGFFYIHQADLAAVNGFNEYITTYGWDDDDLYDRLVTAGMTRIDVAPGTVRHLDHDDAARIEQPDAAQTGWDDLHALTLFKIRTNRFIATMMPGWDRNRILMPYDMTGGDARLRLQRRGQSIHRVPEHLRRLAERLAAYEMLSWRTGLRVFDLPEAALDLLLACRRLEGIRALHVELLLAEAGLVALVAPRHLVVELDEAALAAGAAALTPVWPVIAAAAAGGRVPVLRAPRRQNPLSQAAQPGNPQPGNLQPGNLPPGLADAAELPFVPSYHPIGPARDVTPAEVAADPLTPVLRLCIGAPAAAPAPGPAATGVATVRAAASPLRREDVPAATLSGPDRPATPAIARPKTRLFIDAQHGLGNRLRAIGSAAAVAAATGRDLVVVWEPDHHCEARLTDLFAYEGTVIGKSFLANMQRAGATVLNYMEIEPGAAKGAPLVLTEGRDAYLRSAYVINHPASTWDSENALLRRLRPAPAVEALLEGQPAQIDIGLHVRMEGTPGTDLHSYDRAENWTPEGHAAIHHWRGQSHYARFMARLDALLAETPAARVWLAADLPQTYRAFAETYGSRIGMLERPVYDRSAAQLRYALADTLMLARAEHFLGSNWSSFSELVLRLSARIKRHERSGVDF